MEQFVAAFTEHPVHTAPYTSIRYRRRDGNGTPIYRVGTVEAGGAESAMRAAHERWGSNCFYCGRPMPRDASTEFTLDHVMPQALGGMSDLHNLVFCCRSCNVLKGARPVAAFHPDRAADLAFALDRHVVRTLRALRSIEAVTPAAAAAPAAKAAK